MSNIITNTNASLFTMVKCKKYGGDNKKETLLKIMMTVMVTQMQTIAFTAVLSTKWWVIVVIIFDLEATHCGAAAAARAGWCCDK